MRGFGASHQKETTRTKFLFITSTSPFFHSILYLSSLHLFPSSPCCCCCSFSFFSFCLSSVHSSHFTGPTALIALPLLPPFASPLSQFSPHLPLSLFPVLSFAFHFFLSSVHSSHITGLAALMALPPSSSTSPPPSFSSSSSSTPSSLPPGARLTLYSCRFELSSE